MLEPTHHRTGRGGLRFHRFLAAGSFIIFGVLTVGMLHAQLPAGTTDSTAQPQQQKPDPRRIQASNALDKQDYATALKLLTALATEDPKDARTQYDLGYTQESMGNTNDAAASYRKAIADDAAFFEPHLALGLLLARAGKLAEARAEFVTATTLTPATDPNLKGRAWRALARIDERSNPAAARDELLSALKISPETTEDMMMSGELAEEAKDEPGAEAAYRRVLTANPNDPAASASLAHLLAGQNKLVDAEQILTSALGQHPEDAGLNSELASVYLAENKPDEALAVVKKLHAAAPEDGSITRLYARLLTRTGDYATAEPLWASLSAAHPDEPTLLDDQADALIHLRRFAEAEALLKRAVAQPGAFPTKDDLGMAASHLAFAASEANDPTTTLKALALRSTVLPQSPSALFLAATAHDKLHQAREAADLYKRFLAAANGKFPDEEWQARHRLITLENTK